MKSKLKNEIYYEYKSGNRVKTITTIAGLKQYCSINSLKLSVILMELGFNYRFDEFQTNPQCKICGDELQISSIDIDMRLVYVKTHGCVVNYQSKITRARFDTVLDFDQANIVYNKYCLNKTRNYRPKNCDCGSLKFYIERYGEVEGPIKYHDKNKKLVTTSLSYFMNKGLNEEAARDALRKRQQTFSLETCIIKFGEVDGTTRWKRRQETWQSTINSKPAEELFRINASKGLSKQRFIDKHGVHAWEERCNRMIQVMNDRNWIIIDKMAHREYYSAVRMITKISRSYIDKKPVKWYHLDHIYSIAMGYRTRILPIVIASPVNLRWIGGKENQLKSYRCDIEKTELLNKYEKWINTDDGKHYHEDVNALQSYLTTETTPICE